MVHNGDTPARNEHVAPDNDELRRRLAAAEQALEEQTGIVAQLREENALLRAVIDHMPYAIYWKDANLTYRGCNQRFAADLGLATTAEIVGRTDAEMPWQPGEAATFEAADRRILTTRAVEYDDQETVIYPDGTQEWFETYKLPLHDTAGEVIGILSTYNNITSRKQAEATVEAQATLLQELSTPVIPITDQILVVPLVGAIDSRRAQQVLEVVLERLAESHAEAVFLDITGVPIIDTQVAQALLQTGRAVKLLGSRLVLTGIRPEVAQTMVGLGIELGAIVTYSSLQAGLADVYKVAGKGTQR